mmetsp:Transcript_30254/g.77125  ORF Transcript_30254/g.77125 Transcript_30254/m.77125 type:complete len:103 (-) Transcript_30254:1412-1720(-)
MQDQQATLHHVALQPASSQQDATTTAGARNCTQHAPATAPHPTLPHTASSQLINQSKGGTEAAPPEQHQIQNTLGAAATQRLMSAQSSASDWPSWCDPDPIL